MSPVATPLRVGVRWDVPLLTRSHLDESLQGEKKTPAWAGHWRGFLTGCGLVFAGMGEEMAHLAAEQMGALRALHSGWSVRTAALGAVVLWPHQDLLSQ